MTVASPFTNFHLPRDLVCTFFAVFARFEFALKDSGSITTARGYAVPNWKGFSKSAAKTLQIRAGTELEAAVTHLITYPPWVQVGKDAWEARPLKGASNVEKAIEAAQRVRNNLFHGGKHTPEPHRGRDERLINAVLVLITGLLEQDDALRNSYEQNTF